jgi:hypothetical protein
VVFVFQPVLMMVYMGPGMGSQHASIHASNSQRDRVQIGSIRWLILLMMKMVSWIEVKRLGLRNPEFELRITPRGLAIFEPKANIAFTFSQNMDDENSAYFARMVDLICPEWALNVWMADSSSISNRKL